MDYILRILGAITGTLEGKAWREVRSWTSANLMVKAHKYAWHEKILNRGSRHPIEFLFFLVLVLCVIAYLLVIQDCFPAIKIIPRLKNEGLNVVEFSGVPWGVQATFVALVYPIVLSFVALNFQRKINSAMALRVYLMESAIFPAGSSALGLLSVLGVLYFISPYIEPSKLPDYFSFFSVVSGVWFLFNIYLTANFLRKTVNFLNDDEQHRAFKRAAVYMVMRENLVESVKEHYLVKSPQSAWELPEFNYFSDQAPTVFICGPVNGKVEVERTLGKNLVLVDVRLRLLGCVAKSWLKRANLLKNPGKTPILNFPCVLGAVVSEKVALAAVQDGPALTRKEKFLVRQAFVFKSLDSSRNSTTVAKMLKELASEVVAAIDMHLNEEGLIKYRAMLEMHITLLRACVINTSALQGNAAEIMTSPLAWSRQTFDRVWLEPYQRLSAKAIEGVEKNKRLFSALANFHNHIAQDIPCSTPKLHINSLDVPVGLYSALSDWWIEKSQLGLEKYSEASGGLLPMPFKNIYNDALGGFVSGWARYRIGIDINDADADVAIWTMLSGRAKTLASHLEVTTEMFLGALHRGDEAAAELLFDSLAGWWENNSSQLSRLDDETIDYLLYGRHITLELAELDLPSLLKFLSEEGASEKSTNYQINAVMSLGIRRYWESLKFYLAILLVRKHLEGSTFLTPSLRYASLLVSGKTSTDLFHSGGENCLTRADVFAKALSGLYGVNSVTARLNALGERVNRKMGRSELIHRRPVTYSSNDLSTFGLEFAILMTATGDGDFEVGYELINRWWMDIEKLGNVARACEDWMKHAKARTQEFSVTVSAIHHLLQTAHFEDGSLRTVNYLDAMSKFSRRHRMSMLECYSVHEPYLQLLRSTVARYLFTELIKPDWVGAFTFNADRRGKAYTNDFHVEKIELVYGKSDAKFSFAKSMAKIIRNSISEMLSDYIKRTEASPISGGRLLSAESSVLERQEYLLSLANDAGRMLAKGREPVIIVGRLIEKGLLNPARWGDFNFQYPLPEGVVLSGGSQDSQHKLFLNDVEVIYAKTPGGLTYVLPRAEISKVEFKGDSWENALSINYKVARPDLLELTIAWEAGVD